MTHIDDYEGYSHEQLARRVIHLESELSKVKLSIRDEFIKVIMPVIVTKCEDMADFAGSARVAVMLADELMKERDK